MSQIEQVKTEKPTWTYPSARQTPTAYDVPASLDWVFDVPKGKMLAGLIVDAKLTTVGAGMSLVRISQQIQKMTVYGDGQLVLDADQYCLDLIPIITQWGKHHDDYADLTLAQQVAGSVVVQDDVNVATGAAMYGFWKIAVPLPAKRQIKVHLDTLAGPTVFGAGMTGGVPQYSVVPIWANIGARKQYSLYARQLSGVLKTAYRGVEIGAFFTAAEWNTISNGIKLGGTLSPEQIYAIQSNVGNALALWAPVIGAAVNGRLKTIQDPLPAANTYVLANKFDGQAVAEFAFTTATTVKAIIMSETTPDNIEVQ